MTYEVYRYIFIISTIVCAVMFLVTILLFFLLKIPHVIGDLSGRTAKKAIDDIRQHNMSANTGNIKSVELTDKITASGRLMARRNDSGDKYTDKISTEKLIEDNKLGSNETSVLNSGNETTVLTNNNETTILNGNETTVLSADSCVTTQLAGDIKTGDNIAGFVKVEADITFIHSVEMIND